jgi:hypothetical protein
VTQGHNPEGGHSARAERATTLIVPTTTGGPCTGAHESVEQPIYKLALIVHYGGESAGTSLG